METVTISHKGAAWARTGHPWIYRSDLVRGADPSLSGEIVNVNDDRERFVARAFYSHPSKIALRILTRSAEEMDRAFWTRRIDAALAYRRHVAAGTNAFRAVYGESDSLPGLIADVYDGHLVVQTLIPGMERLKALLADMIGERLEAKSVTLRNDIRVRRLEGLAQEKTVLRGQPPEAIEIAEGDVRYLVDIMGGHKTGAYLDQRENRLAVGSYAGGERALDAFAYHGGFSLHLARRVRQVVAVESSASALEMLAKNVALNAAENIEAVRANVFQWLRAESQVGTGRYDFIVLDPPAFAKSKPEVAEAVRGYKEINLRAMRLLKAGGLLMTCSCSYNLPEVAFLDMLREAAYDAGRHVVLVERRGQARDHPILIGLPETAYLKCAVLRVT